MSYYLGIDGGGTKTTCAVGDDTRSLATATAGPSNVFRVGEMRARESLRQAVREACAAAGILPDQVLRTCVGGSGAARPELAESIRRILSEVLATPVDVVGDMEIALAGAFGEGPGVIVIGGTGSSAYGRNRDGATARAGGWGFAVGDEGSAHWIGRSAVRAVLRAADEAGDALANEPSRRSSLASMLCQTWEVASLIDLARTASSNPPPDFAALFPVVAASEDQLAAAVLSSAGKELARIAAIVIQRLFQTDFQSIPVAMIGGVFRHAPLAYEAFYNDLRKMDSRVEINPVVVEPVEGALRLARRAAAAQRK